MVQKSATLKLKPFMKNDTDTYRRYMATDYFFDRRGIYHVYLPNGSCIEKYLDKKKKWYIVCPRKPSSNMLSLKHSRFGSPPVSTLCAVV